MTSDPSKTLSDPIGGLPESLLTPLLDAAGEVLKRLEPDQVPVPLRALKSFDARGLTRGAARHQLLRALELDTGFRDRVIEGFIHRPEVTAVLAGWDGARPVEQATAAAERQDLPLLASAIYAARPEGWRFALGVVCGASVSNRRAKEEDDDVKALRARLAVVDEARRRAENMRATLAEDAERLERDLREERRSRRAREVEAERQVDVARRRAAELEEALAEARAEVQRAEGRRLQAAERTREAEGELRATRRELLEAERTLAEARETLARAPAPGTGLRHADLQALVDAADLARRLADGLGGVAQRARGLASRGSDMSPRASAATPTRDAGDAIPTEAPRAPHATRRVPVPVPSGLAADAPEAVGAMLRTPGLSLVVDGYNVSMHAWPTAAPAEQRERLIDLMAEVHLRFRCAVTLVFDGADVGPVRPQRRAGVHVVFSAADEEADLVVVREIAALPPEVPALAVSSDGWVREHAAAAGARVIPSSALVRVLRA